MAKPWKIFIALLVGILVVFGLVAFMLWSRPGFNDVVDTVTVVLFIIGLVILVPSVVILLARRWR